ncbi:MAG: zinc ribbon domain-containing protein [Acidaminococcus sp.]|jgi:hypothetical protein|nr:zinc ribbon domain-containing protein [Acidaminococcus sp.]
MANLDSAVSFKIGESFPLALHEGDTVMLELMDGTFSLVAYQTAPTQEEVAAISRGGMELSLTLLPVDPHLFLDAELDSGETLQCAFYIKSCSPEMQELIMSQGAPQTLRIFLVDTPSNKLMAMRTILFDEDFSESFYMALKGQTLSSYEPVHAEGAIMDTEMKYTPADGYEYVESHLDVAPLDDTETAQPDEEEPAEEDTDEEAPTEEEPSEESLLEEAAAENAAETPVETNPDFAEDMDAAIKDVLSRYPAPKLSGYFCYYCGTPLIEGANFCYKCGKRQPKV